MLYSSFMDSGEKGGASILSVNIHQKRKPFEKNVPLYDALKAGLGQSVPWAHRGHWPTCLWRLVALIQRGEVSLRVFHRNDYPFAMAFTLTPAPLPKGYCVHISP